MDDFEDGRLRRDGGQALTGVPPMPIEDKDDSKLKLYLIGGAVLVLVLFILIIWGLYQLGGPFQSPLERLRDIAVIFIVLLHLVTVILLAGVAAALGFAAFALKDRVIPLLEELTGTVHRARGTVDFVTEEAVRPIVNIAGTVARVRAMGRAARGKPPAGGTRL